MKKKINFREKGSEIGKGFLVLIVISLIITSITIYYNQFSGFQKSNDPAVWGAFGDYMGGVLNPIIALAGTVLLAIISLQLNKSDSKEKHKYFIVEKRINAYNILTNKVSNLKNSAARLNTSIALVKLDEDNSISLIKDENKARIDGINIVKELFNEVLCFALQYEHLFEYNFHDEAYTDITNQIDIVINEIDAYLLRNNKNVDYDDLKEEKLIGLIDVFIEDLREELVIKV